jgi:anti-anti-sigma factor
VPLTLEHRRVGDITIVTCAGRIVEGAESIALRNLLDELLPFGPHLVLDVGAVEFVDSSGLGLLARYAARTRKAGGAIRLCAPSKKVSSVLKATRLEQVFDSHESEADAITAFYRGSPPGAAAPGISADILCVIESIDVQAYVRELLGQTGYCVLTAGNLPDGLVLLQATQPKLVVITAGLRQTRTTHAAEKFNRLADRVSVIELPADFSSSDAGDVGQALLERVRALST